MISYVNYYLSNDISIIRDALLSVSYNKIRVGQPLTLRLSFKIGGNIREVFDHKSWERAYNRHDNDFRMGIKLLLKSGRKPFIITNFTRKAALFWTRNPKIPHTIWVSIIKDDMSFYPLSVEEAKSLLFDVDKIIELNDNELKPGIHKLSADIKVSWGRHIYATPTEICGKSNIVEIIVEGREI
jgi:hypothetical protein